MCLCSSDDKPVLPTDIHLCLLKKTKWRYITFCEKWINLYIVLFQLNIETTYILCLSSRGLWKEISNSDGQPFKYIHKTNNHFSPQLTETMMTIKNTIIYDVRDPGPGFGQPEMCGGVRLVYWKNLVLSFMCSEACN